MATSSLGNLTVRADWQDVVATYASAVSVDVLIQNLDDDTVAVVFGGDSAPSGMSGVVLDTYDTVTGNADHIWVRGAGNISVTLL